jgi:hypothetical protein
MSAFKLLAIIIVGVIAAIIAAELPELRRYMTIRSM